MSRDLQQLFFEYYQIYYITMDFHNIYFPFLQTFGMFEILKMLSNTSYFECKHGAKLFFFTI